jgi:hypothetical protein
MNALIKIHATKVPEAINLSVMQSYYGVLGFILMGPYQD